jgi:hypothetical protein
MQLTDLKIGMYITCTGAGSIPVYFDTDTASKVLLNVAPGQVIGQIVDFKSTDKEWVIFSSDQISADNPWYDRALSILPGFAAVGAVLFTDIQANVSDDVVKAQNALMATNAAQAATLQNDLKNTAKSVGEDVGAVASGLFSGVGGWLTVAALGFVAYKVVIEKPERYYKPH